MADDAVASLDIKQRHKNEVKELQAKIQSMKHAIPKGDKKRKKQVMADIAKLEAEMEERHKRELQNWNVQGDISEGITEVADKMENVAIDDSSVKPAQKISKAQRRREKKDAEERERLQRIAAAEAENVHSARNVEAEKFKKILVTNSLQIKEVLPDGNCLYNAVADQLTLKGCNRDYKYLRLLTSKYMRENNMEFIPFMTDHDSGEPFTDDMFSTYCDNIEKTTAWGGQIEIRAMSEALKMAVQVYQADAPVLEIGMEFGGDPIRLSYHKHEYGLGEHYNSLIPADNVT